ncbi:n-acetylglutamate synthase [Cryomorphaceae bacterium 1068]|nr:n-acetylglutamate synthase [Cryomorphaceae bacterium 1068]
MNYDGKKFRPVQNTENGETSAETTFEYRQIGNILTSEYSGGQILKGHLIGLVAEDGSIDMRYHQVNTKGNLMTGRCYSRPERMTDGRIRLHENWEWTSGDKSKGMSVLEEIQTEIK